MSEAPHYLINGSQQSLSPLDRGVTYGDGVFRTLPVYDGKPSNWALQYKKLVDDCAVLGINCPDAMLLLSDIEQLFSLNQAQAVAKIIITRGEGTRGYAIPQNLTPTRIVIKSHFPHYHPQYFTEGVKLTLCQTRLGLQPQLAGIKHLNKLENILARQEWTDETIVDGVMLDTNGYVIECTSSNIFARFGNLLVTPDLTECGVTGVTRQRIIQAMPGLGLNLSIKKITLDELLTADELLICNSLFGAWQVLSLDQKVWPKSRSSDNLSQTLSKTLQDSCN